MENVSWEDRDGTRWIELEGELDSTGTLELQDRFQDAIRTGDGDVVVLLAGVRFLSSLAVGMLLKAREELMAKSRKLMLSGVNPNVRRALELMQLAHVFDEI
jgi:anti-anti-sigma factor